MLAPYYRDFELPWDVDPQESRRLRRYVGVALVLFLFLQRYIVAGLTAGSVKG